MTSAHRSVTASSLYSRARRHAASRIGASSALEDRASRRISVARPETSSGATRNPLTPWVMISGEGAWKVRARVDGRWRDAAWRGPEPVPSGDGPVQVELSPRGYVRLRRDEP